MRVSILGRNGTLIKAARAVVENGHAIGLVATAKARPEYSADENDYRKLATDSGVPFHQDPKINDPDFIAELAASRCDVAISANWPSLIKRPALDAFHLGILNHTNNVFSIISIGQQPYYRQKRCIGNFQKG